MGQKINPNIFRLGINKKTWKTEFFEKKRQEFAIYTFKDLELKNYIERFLETHGLFLHNYKQHYSNSTLNLYISYFVSPEFIGNQSQRNAKLMLVDKLGNKKVITNTYSSNKKPKFLTLKSFSYKKDQISFDNYHLKKYIQSQFVSVNSNSQDYTDASKENTLEVNSILNNLFKVLSLFTGNKFNIITTFCCLNRNTSFLKQTRKKDFITLQKFQSTPFFKEGFELLFHSIYNKNSASLLARFIAVQIRKVKRHKLLITFLKQTLTTLITSNFSKVKGVKIIIKGRLNGVPRARHRILTIGDVPIQSVNVPINYAQTTAHNANGSYGIKVWLVEKK